MMSSDFKCNKVEKRHREHTDLKKLSELSIQEKNLECSTKKRIHYSVDVVDKPGEFDVIRKA